MTRHNLTDCYTEYVLRLFDDVTGGWLDLPHPKAYVALFRRALWEAHSGLCGVCRLPVELERMHVDHVTSQWLGGGHEWANLQPAHGVCNSSKGAGYGVVTRPNLVKYRTDEERKMAHRIQARDAARRKAALKRAGLELDGASRKAALKHAASSPVVRVPVECLCSQCGKTFQASRRGARYCSGRCRTRAYRSER